MFLIPLAVTVAAARIGSPLFRHPGVVYQMGQSPDGRVSVLAVRDDGMPRGSSNA